MRLRNTVFLFGLLFASCGVAIPARAQHEPPHRVELEEENRDPASRGREGMGFFAIGTHELDLGDLNGALLAGGFLPFRERTLSLGGAGWGVRGRWLIGGEGHGLTTPSRSSITPSNYKTRLTAGYGMVDVGYRIAGNENVAVFPMLGVGGGGIVLDITERGAFDFEDVLADPGRGVRLSGAVFALSVSLGATFKADGRKTRRGEGGLALGVRAGYVFSKAPNDWKLNEEGDVIGVPDVALGGPFASVMLGGWGRRGNP